MGFGLVQDGSHIVPQIFIDEFLGQNGQDLQVASQSIINYSYNDIITII